MTEEKENEDTRWKHKGGPHKKPKKAHRRKVHQTLQDIIDGNYDEEELEQLYTDYYE